MRLTRSISEDNIPILIQGRNSKGCIRSVKIIARGKSLSILVSLKIFLINKKTLDTPYGFMITNSIIGKMLLQLIRGAGKRKTNLAVTRGHLTLDCSLGFVRDIKKDYLEFLIHLRLETTHRVMSRELPGFFQIPLLD